MGLKFFLTVCLSLSIGAALAAPASSTAPRQAQQDLNTVRKEIRTIQSDIAKKEAARKAAQSAIAESEQTLKSTRKELSSLGQQRLQSEQKLMELTARTGQFYKGNLSRGDLLESDASIVIIGDVERGARVSARGNIVVLGTLAGSAHAGAAGSEDAVITALEMSPMHLRIADLTAKTRSQGKKMGRGPMIASVSDGNIDVESVKKSFLDYFHFI